jgi:hypothetical protein
MSETPIPNSVNSNLDPGWLQVAQEMHTYHPVLQEHVARNLAERGIEISPDHRQEHIDIARPVVPNIDELPPEEQNLIGEIMEIGHEALENDMQSPEEGSSLMEANSLPTGKLDNSHAAVISLPSKPNALQIDGPVMGVVRLPNGEIDYSQATVVSFPSKSGESNTERSEALHEIPTLETVLSDAEKVGIDESRLKQLSQTLRMLDKPHEQMPALKRIIKRDGMSLAADEMLKLTRSYQREIIKSRENGTLSHYHQTSLDNLESILDNGGLLSTDEQRQRGSTIRSAGSRPDVVQMTRDRYDANGNLVDAGIKATSSGLGVAGEIAFVIDESVMDDPDYDSIVNFPNAPRIPISQMKAILVSNEGQIPFVQDILSKKGIHKEVISRSAWLGRYNQSSSVAGNNLDK